MESWKHSRYPKTILSKDEQASLGPDQQEDKDDAVSKRRFYECTFCKRGFTNAQALGGHMNIHRRQRARPNANKAIQPQQPSSSTTTTTSDFIESMDNPWSGSDSAKPFYSVWESQRASKLRNPLNYLERYSFRIPSFECLSKDYDYELFGTNLGLRVDQPSVELGEVVRINQAKEEIDLELRLGSSHY